MINWEDYKNLARELGKTDAIEYAADVANARKLPPISSEPHLSDAIGLYQSGQISKNDFLDKVYQTTQYNKDPLNWYGWNHRGRPPRGDRLLPFLIDKSFSKDLNLSIARPELYKHEPIVNKTNSEYTLKMANEMANDLPTGGFVLDEFDDFAPKKIIKDKLKNSLLKGLGTISKVAGPLGTAIALVEALQSPVGSGELPSENNYTYQNSLPLQGYIQYNQGY